MLNLFLSNRASTVIVIPILLLVFWFGSFFQILPNNIEPTYAYSAIYQEFQVLPLLNRVLGFLTAVILVFVISRIFNANDFYSKENAIPSLMLIIMIGAWNGFHFFSPIYFSLILLLMAVSRILKIYHQKSVIRELFDASFLIGLAALFYYPIILFGLSIWGFLTISRSFNWREFVVPLFGLLLPFYFLWVAFFYFDIQPDFFKITSVSELNSMLFQVGLTQRLYLVITVILLAFSLFYLFRVLDRAKVQMQLARKFLLIFFLNGILIYWVSLFYYPINERALFLIVPMAMILPFFFIESKPLVKNLSIYFWLLAALLFNYLSMY
ncbi:MAG: hypothetical protein DRI54_00820 [Bacteroidetes bacterium]|nr:MAG: hypothetical protein DRI54_00820 [Bacteroidota bacterium]